MLRLLTESQAHTLKRLSDKYLQTEDTSEDSIEVVKITELTVLFWVYLAGADKGKEVVMPWFEFVVGILAPIMFKSQLFKFNGIISKCIMNSASTREDLLVAFEDFDTWLEDKKARKEADLKSKEAANDKAANPTPV